MEQPTDDEQREQLQGITFPYAHTSHMSSLPGSTGLHHSPFPPPSPTLHHFSDNHLHLEHIPYPLFHNNNSPNTQTNTLDRASIQHPPNIINVPQDQLLNYPHQGTTQLVNDLNCSPTPLPHHGDPFHSTMDNHITNTKFSPDFVNCSYDGHVTTGNSLHSMSTTRLNQPEPQQPNIALHNTPKTTMATIQASVQAPPVTTAEKMTKHNAAITQSTPKLASPSAPPQVRPRDILTSSIPSVSTNFAPHATPNFLQTSTTSPPLQRQPLFSTIPVQSTSQNPEPWMSSPQYSNPLIYPSHRFNPLDQAPGMSYRPQIPCVNVPPQLNPERTNYLRADEYTPILPRSTISHFPHSNTVTTLTAPEKHLPPQSFEAQCAGSTSNIAPPFEDIPLTHDAFHCLPHLGHGSRASQGSETQPLVSLYNPFTHPSLCNGMDMRYNTLQGTNSIYTGPKQPRRGPHHQGTPPPQLPIAPLTDDSKTREIENSENKRNGSRCSYCNKTFKTEKDKQRHVQRMHLKRGRFPCPHSPCKQSFAEAHKLSRHIRTVHLLNRPFKCPQCDSAFGERGNMQQHVRKAHLGQGRKAKRARKN